MSMPQLQLWINLIAKLGHGWVITSQIFYVNIGLANLLEREVPDHYGFYIRLIIPSDRDWSLLQSDHISKA